MGQLSYSSLYGIDHDRGYAEAIVVGDIVRTGPNHFPQFIVVAVDGDKAWVRNTDNGVDGVTSLARCRKIDG